MLVEIVMYIGNCPACLLLIKLFIRQTRVAEEKNLLTRKVSPRSLYMFVHARSFFHPFVSKESLDVCATIINGAHWCSSNHAGRKVHKLS